MVSLIFLVSVPNCSLHRKVRPIFGKGICWIYGLHTSILREPSLVSTSLLSSIEVREGINLTELASHKVNKFNIRKLNTGLELNKN